jgi:molecular chaperone DnaK (HSP70)
MDGGKNGTEARVIVGLDFGTTYSGYAFAHKSEPKDIFTFYDWAGAPKPYCKTITGIYYKQMANGELRFRSWGYPARTEFQRDCTAVRKMRGRVGDHVPVLSAVDLPVHSTVDLPVLSPIDMPVVGSYLTRFKLHLADHNSDDTAGGKALSSACDLPSGLSLNRVISDYLRELGRLIIQQLQASYGKQLTMESVQWCVTVPSIWSDSAKQQMRACMVDAGLVVGRPDAKKASPHPLVMVLEPEAASCHCHRNLKQLRLQRGDKLLVADIGGGTADIVVQEWVGDEDNFKVKEVTRSTGGLCGGTYVDKQFIATLCQKIGCLNDYFEQFPGYMSQLLKTWEELKCSFGDPLSAGEDVDIQLHQALASAWEDYEERLGLPPRDAYDEIQLTYQDMQRIFDPVVNKNLELIAAQLSQTTGIKAMLVVGGFAGSPYLMARIRERFQDEVLEIVSPPSPGSAVCQGAVALALNPGGIVSRIARKTYGVEILPDFEEGDDPANVCYDGGVKRCKNRFYSFVQKGTPVEVDQCITKQFYGTDVKNKAMTILLFSSDETSPRYTTGKSCVKEGELVIDTSNSAKLKTKAEVTVSMYFGRSCIEVQAVAVNFKDKAGVHQMQLPVKWV